MINAQVKIFNSTYSGDLQKEVNIFLETIDIRQVIKMDFIGTGDDNKRLYCTIVYVGIDDIRDAKIDNILEIK